MYVITDKTGVIIKLSKTLDYQENGNPLVDNGSLAIAAILVGEISGDIKIPDGVNAYTHTWIDGKFAKNLDYAPPEPVVDNAALADQLTDIQLAVAELYETILGGGV